MVKSGFVCRTRAAGLDRMDRLRSATETSYTTAEQSDSFVDTVSTQNRSDATVRRDRCCLAAVV
ncbi:MAG: hypothetical protein J07HX5_02051 [halophilic archaeon J07HX5]|nr:MAG: hypothetical protein J07HX5_02051 [halophilic archaeon J07HX5]